MSRLFLFCLIIITSLLSSVVFAGSYSCQAESLTVPCGYRGWEFSASGVFLETSNDDLGYYSNKSVLPNQYSIIKPKHRFGFSLDAVYHLSQGRDLSIDWLHFNHAFDDSTYVVLDDATIRASAKHDIDAVNVQLGQWIDVGARSRLRVFYGAHLVNMTHRLMSRRLESEEESGGVKAISSFDGVGPTVGVDWQQRLSMPRQLSFVAHAAMALLVGDLSAELRQSSGEQEVTFWEPYITKHKRRVIIPHGDLQLGLQWRHLVGFDGGRIAAEMGWHFFGYFQSVHTLNVRPAPRPLQNVSNFTGQGPYLKLSVRQA